MKIVITVNKYNPNLDGVQFVTNYICEELTKLGNDIILITSLFTVVKSKEFEKINGVSVFRLPMQTKHTFHFGNKKKYRRFLLEKCKDADCLINVGTQVSFTDWAFKVLKRINCKKILYVHSIWDFKIHKSDFSSFKSILFKLFNNLRWSLYYINSGRFFKMYNNVIQLHEEDYSVRFFKKRYDITSDIIYNAADNIFFEDKVHNKNDDYIIYVANYLDRKNQLDAVKIFEKIIQKCGTNMKLYFVGSEKSPYYYKLINYVKTHKLEDKIYCYVGMSRIETINLIKDSKFILMTSKWEAFPISIIEGMAAGKPFLSTDVGVVRFFPGGITGDLKTLEKWVLLFIKNQYLIDDYGKIARDFAKENFVIKKQVSKLLTYIKE